MIAFERRRDADEFARYAGEAAGETVRVESTTLAAIAANMGAERVGVDICVPFRPDDEVDAGGAPGGGTRLRVERALVLAREDAVAAARDKLEKDVAATNAWFDLP